MTNFLTTSSAEISTAGEANDGHASSFKSERKNFPNAKTSNDSINMQKELLQKWKKYSDDKSLMPASAQQLRGTSKNSNSTFLLKIHLHKMWIQIFLDEREIYGKKGFIMMGNPSLGGVHFLVIHPNTGKVMSAKQFKTSQPGDSRALSKAISRVLPGRLLVLVLMPHGAFYLENSTKEAIERLGATKIGSLAYDETWAFCVHSPEQNQVAQSKTENGGWRRGKKFKVWLESLFLSGHKLRGASPSLLSWTVPKIPLPRCEWETLASRRSQSEFCRTYDGYPEMCRCSDPIDPKLLRTSSPLADFRETIPLALLTAVNSWNFYRQVLNLLTIDGAAETPIFVFVDGYNEEIVSLARLFDLPVHIHKPQGDDGDYSRLNMHFRFSVFNIFDLNPNADKAIVLEDDLLLSPDFLRYFHQTAWLLDADPTIYCVNAFSVNSFATVASGPTRMRRANSFPQFGWMITREWVVTHLPLWVYEEATNTDWDWWLGKSNIKKNHDVIVPEISRTFHAGTAGTHVTGWEQAFHFNKMIYNQDPDVRLGNLEGLIQDKYDSDLREKLGRAEFIPADFDPFNIDTLFSGQGSSASASFKVVVGADSFNHEENYGFLAMAYVFHGHTRDYRDVYKGVQQYHVRNITVYIVGCPISPFCESLGKNLSMLHPNEEAIEEANRRDMKWRSDEYPLQFRVRRTPEFPEEEFWLQNLNYLNKSLV